MIVSDGVSPSPKGWGWSQLVPPLNLPLLIQGRCQVQKCGVKHMASAEREPLQQGSWVEPQRGPGAEPW